MTTENQNNIDNNIEKEINSLTIPDEINRQENPLPKREILKSEKILLVMAFITAVLFDRLFVNILFKQTENLFYFAAIFEIGFIILFCAFNWEKIYKKPLICIIAGLLILLCVWNLIFDYRSSYGILTFLVIPASLMMFTQLASEEPDFKNIFYIVILWFAGWIIKPLSAIHKCVEVISGLLSPKNNLNKSIIQKVIIALLITVPLISILIALLSGADRVFGYYVEKILETFNIADFILHGIIIIIGFLGFYSFFWNGKYNKLKKSNNFDMIKKEYKADNLIFYIILGAVLTLYMLFCTIQFAYLFASAGLPDGISYSEYAREGFAQIVVISGINLVVFGFVIRFGKIHKPGEKDIVLKVMLYILVAVTAIMLTSGFMRLGLYINTFGMTFLRLISAWFMIYLALVLVLCIIRLIEAKLPLISYGAVLLLVSYIILGYINPDSFIIKYNLSDTAGYYQNYDSNINNWVEKNYYYVFDELSDDALNVLIDRGLDKNIYAEELKKIYSESKDKYSFASIRLKSNLTEYAEK